MEVKEEGVITQLKRKFRKQRYRYATVFVDHFSDWSDILLQRALTSNDIVKAQMIFEAYAANMGVKSLHHHEYNGRFMDNLFLHQVQ